MKLSIATSVGGVLLSAGSGLLLLAEEMTDATAIAGATGIVISGSLLVLTALARYWRGGAVTHVRTAAVDAGSIYDELASVFDLDGQVIGHEDAAAV